VKTIYEILALLAAMSITACSNDSTLSEPATQERQEQKTQMLFEGTIQHGNATRVAGTSSPQYTEMAVGNIVGAFIYRTGLTAKETTGEGYGFNNKKLTRVSGTRQLYTPDIVDFPTEGTRAVDIYAYAPYDEAYTSLTTQTFAVQEDQSTTDGYIKSDLLYGKLSNVAKTSTINYQVVPITFDHKLTQIIVKVKIGAAIYASDLQGTDVMLTGISRTGNINLQTGEAAIANPSTALSQHTRSQQVKVFVYGQTEEGTDDLTVTQGYAVVYPHNEYDLVNAKLEFTIGTTTYKANLKTATTTQWDAGKSYTYEVTVSQAGLSVTTSLSDWVTGAETPGTAE